MMEKNPWKNKFMNLPKTKKKIQSLQHCRKSKNQKFKLRNKKKNRKKKMIKERIFKNTNLKTTLL